MSFRTAEPNLKDVLADIHNGIIQLPDFQREWVWDDRHILELIASVSLSFPIGAVMFLEAGGVPFQTRLFEGVELSPAPAPKKLVLDGQQRLTSMYLALYSGKPVKTKTDKGEKAQRVYFLDMEKCLDPHVDREDAIVSVSEKLILTSDFGRKVELDLSTSEQQYAKKMFPVSLLFNSERWMQWRMGYNQYHNGDANASIFLMQFENAVWLPFQQFKVPAIELGADTTREAVCKVFEKVNTGGVTLTVFELVTATFAASHFNLPEDWKARSERMSEKHRVLESVDGTTFLTALTLYVSFRKAQSGSSAVTCKRRDVLELAGSDYQQFADELENGFKKAAQLLAEEKIFDARFLPYATQFIPLSCICASLSEDIDNASVKKKILHWYWCGVFGELYGGANETRFSQDLPDVIAWVNGGNDPRTIKDASFAPRRLLSLQTRGSAAYKGLTALLMQSGGKDFVSGTPIDLNTYFDNAIDIHHIFPKAWCSARTLPKEKWNSVINKTPLSSKTNQYLGGDAPSVYIRRIEEKKDVPAETLDICLHSHGIPVAELRRDDFDGFIRQRAILLLDMIESAMGKAVSGRDSDETMMAFGASLKEENV